jgi:hypothetical protein
MLYEFLTGRVPFSGEDWAVKAAQVQKDPDLAQVRAQSASLASVVERALAKDPGQRWQSVAEMHNALATQPSVSTQVFAGKAHGVMGTEATAAPAKARSRLPWAIGVAALIFGGAGLAAWSGADHAEPAVSENARSGGGEGHGPVLPPPGLQEPIVAPAVAPAEPPRPQQPDPRERLIGKWGIDPEKIGEMEEIKKMPEDQRKAAIEMAKSFAGSMSFEFSEDLLMMEAMGQRKVGTYKVTKVVGNQLTLAATLDGKTEILQAEFKGRRMILGKDKERFTLQRK